MKLGIITYKDVVSIDYYRTLGFYPFFENLEVCHIPTKEVDWHTVSPCDAVVVSRPVHPLHHRWCQIVKACGCKLIVDYDDDLLNIPKVPQFRSFHDNRGIIETCLKEADLVIVSTPKLKEIYGWYNEILVRPNFHNDKMFPLGEFNGNDTIGFRGSKLVHEWNIKAFMDIFYVEGEWIFWGRHVGDSREAFGGDAVFGFYG